MVADPLAEALGDADLVRGADLGGPAAHAGGLEGVPTDEGDLGVVGERERAVVGEHGHALGGEAEQLFAAYGVVRLGQVGGPGARLAEGADPVGQSQQPTHVVVEHGRRHRSGLDRVDQRLAPRTVRAGHHEVQPAVGRGGRGPRREPVRHEQAVPSPLALEDAVVDVALLGGGQPVDVVVRGHHRPRVGVGDRDLERKEVDLPHGAFVHGAVDRVPVGLRLVGDQVLEAGADAVLLQPADVRRGEQAGEQRVLGVGLEETATQRGAVQVDRRPEHDVDLLSLRLLREQHPDLVGRLRAPRRRQQRGVGQQAGRAAAGELQPAHAGGTVGERHRGQPDGGLLVQGEERGTGQQPDLRLEVEPAEQVVEIHWTSVACGWVPPVRWTAGRPPRQYAGDLSREVVVIVP